MSTLDMCAMAFRNLLKRKLRAFLTVFSVVIGMCAIIILVSLSIGMDKNLTESFSRMGELLTVTVYKPWNMRVYSDSASAGTGSEDGAKLDDAAVERFAKINGALAATPFLSTYGIAASGKYIAGLNIVGIAPEALPYMGFKYIEGGPFTGEAEFEAIFGYNTPFDFYNPRDRNRVWTWWWPGSGEEDTRVSSVDVLKDEILFSFDYNFGQNIPSQTPGARPMKPYTLRPTGWIEYNGGQYDYSVIMPLKDAVKLKQQREKWEKETYTRPGGSGGNKSLASEEYEQAIVRFSDLKYVADGAEEIRGMGFEVNSLGDILKETQKTQRSIQLVLGIVGGVALFIAAIGIANTMFMSTYERTREIGIMKVIGATFSDIRRLFLFEAALIGLAGGILGIGLSYLGSFAINKFGIPFFDQIANVYGNETEHVSISIIPLWLCAASAVFAIVIGVLSGFFPARRAMKISALAAIRNE